MVDWKGRLEILDYDSAVAMRYHGYRKGFLDGLSRLDPALSVVLGGSAFATILTGHATAAAVSALLVTASSALNLAFGFGERARLHESLFSQWGDLRAELAKLVENDDTALRLLEVKRARIDAASPWQLQALSTICENDEKRMRGDGDLYRVGRFQRAIASFFTLPGWVPVQDIPAAPKS